MSKTVFVEAEDLFTNKIYFIRNVSNGDWCAVSKSGIPHAFSNFSDNGTLFYIALCDCENKRDALKVIREHGTYLKKGSVK